MVGPTPGISCEAVPASDRGRRGHEAACPCWQPCRRKLRQLHPLVRRPALAARPLWSHGRTRQQRVASYDPDVAASHGRHAAPSGSTAKQRDSQHRQRYARTDEPAQIARCERQCAQLRRRLAATRDADSARRSVTAPNGDASIVTQNDRSCRRRRSDASPSARRQPPGTYRAGDSRRSHRSSKQQACQRSSQIAAHLASLPAGPPNTGDKLRSGARVPTAAGAGMRRHVHAGNHAAESFVSFIPLFGGAALTPAAVRRRAVQPDGQRDPRCRHARFDTSQLDAVRRRTPRAASARSDQHARTAAEQHRVLTRPSQRTRLRRSRPLSARRARRRSR